MSADDMTFLARLIALLVGSGAFGAAVGFVISRMGRDDDDGTAPPPPTRAMDTSDYLHWTDVS